jgi:hypothetical protein
MTFEASATHRVTRAEMGVAIDRLQEFVSIPSLSDSSVKGYDFKYLTHAAKYTIGLLTLADFTVRCEKVNDSAPFILAERVGTAAAYTLLCYAHYDVQPTGEWEGNPFIPTLEGRRLFGRGACDGKGGIIALVTALGSYLEAYKNFPINIKVFIEGGAEFGSPSMSQLVQKKNTWFKKSDAVVVMDGKTVIGEQEMLINPESSPPRQFTKMHFAALAKSFSAGAYVQSSDGAGPFLEEIEKIAPEAEVMRFGVETSDCGARDDNEFLDLDVLEKTANALIQFIHSMGRF